jgi:hypothetical protein
LLEGIFAQKSNKIVADRGKFVANNMYSSPNIITMPESRRIGWDWQNM